MKKLNPLTWFKRGPHVAVIRLYGAIGMPGRFSQSISHAPLEKAIEAAFSSKRTKAVAMVINSPGGSAAQSGLIARHIRRLADEKDIPVIAFCEDAAASGGYLMACAADEIIVDEYSVVGSIGVISASFGATEAIEKLGVERRVHTAGERKLLMDPFRPEQPEDVARLDGLLKDIHRQFIAWVKRSRGERLAEGTEYFEGDVWVGQKAVDVGIADAVGHLRPIMQNRYGDDIKFREFGPKKPSLFARLSGAGTWQAGVNGELNGSAAESAGGGAVRAALQVLEDRSIWARYGL